MTENGAVPRNRAESSGSVGAFWLLPFHPVMLAAVPVLTILAQNTLEVSPGDVIRPILLSIAASLLILAALWAITRRLQLAALLTSSYILLFHAYGHLYSGHVQGVLQPMLTRLNLAGNPSALLTLILILTGFVTFAIFRLDMYLPPMTVIANAVGVSLIVVAAGTSIRSEWRIHREPPAPPSSESLLAAAERVPPSADRPDVYYIILDGYGRADVLAGLYAHDNRGFLDALNSLGFEIVDDARANYMQTGLSLSSSLNADYLDTLLTEGEREGSTRLPLSRLLQHSQVLQSFQAIGYTTIALESGYRPTELTQSDRYIALHDSSTSMLERLLIENSGLVLFQGLSAAPTDFRFPGYAHHRQIIESEASTLQHQMGALPSPKFVFVHFLVPHPPFVFDAEGDPRQPGYPYVLLDGSAFPGDRESYRLHYRDQLAYTNDLILGSLETMVQGSAKDSIIILQSDHGPGTGLVWDSLKDTNVQERMSILLAFRLPEPSGGPIRSFQTPVNLFRALFNRTFGTKAPLLEEVSYYSTWDRPYDFMPIPEEQINDHHAAILSDQTE